MLILVVAMAAEAELLSAALEPRAPVGRRPAFAGELACGPVLLVLGGMGLANAAQATGAALEAHPEATGVINLGCAGAFSHAGLEVGRVVVADRVIHADMGVQTTAYLHGLEKVGIPLGRDADGGPIYNEITCSVALSARLFAAAPGAAVGAMASVGRVSGDEATARAVAERWGAMVEEMEAAAVAQVAALFGVPFAAVRGVSNITGRRSLDVAAGAEAAQRVVLAME